MMSNVRKYGKYTPYHDVNDTVVSLLPVDVVLGGCGGIDDAFCWWYQLSQNCLWYVPVNDNVQNQMDVS